MTVLVERAIDVFASTDAAGNKRPIDPDAARRWGILLERMAVYGAVAAATKLALDAITPASGTYPGGIVFGGSEAGFYAWNGSDWGTKIRSLPDTAATLTNVAGTANAITADTETGVDPAEVKLRLLVPVYTNTGATTLAENGGSAVEILSRSGNSLVGGELVAGELAIIGEVGGELRLANSARILPYQGAYSAGTTYALGDLVENGGATWYSLQNANQGNTPVEGAYWSSFLPGATVGDGSITSAKLADDAVTGAKADIDSIVAEQFTTGLTDFPALSAPTIIQQLLERITPEMAGADGGGDSGDAATNHTALQRLFNAAQGKVIVLPRAADYTFDDTAQLTIPDGVIIEDKGAQFSFIGTDTGTTARIQAQGRLWANRLAFFLPTGNEVYRFMEFAGDVVIGEVSAISEDQINNRDATNTAALRFLGNSSIDKLISDKFDNAHDAFGSVSAVPTMHARIGDCLITNYVRGLHFDQCYRTHVEGGLIQTASANAAVSPGHNAILLEGCYYSVVENVALLDAGEHALRAGTSGDAIAPKSIKVDSVTVERCGGSAFKLNDNSVCENVSINNFSAIDCGPEGGDLSNAMGLFLEKASRVSVTGFTVGVKDNTYSCYRGISINGVGDGVITGFNIQNCADDGIFVKSTDGDIEKLLIDTGIIHSVVANGIEVQHGANNARIFHVGSGVHISGYDNANSATYYGLDVTTSVSALQPCVMSAKIEDRGGNAAGVSRLQGGAEVKNNIYTM